MIEKTKVYFIVGPTASGKTSAAVTAALRIKNCEIISADSIQVYKDLNVGSAKPSMDERCGIVHHLFDIAEPAERDFSVARYREAAVSTIYDVSARGNVPLVVGGTGLYVNSLTYPLQFAEVAPDTELRSELYAKEVAKKGALHTMLSDIDPVTAKRLHPNDVKRIIRALEVFYVTGSTISEKGNDFANKQNKDCEFDVCMVGIDIPREILYERINTRVDAMLENGLEKETRELLLRGVPEDSPAMQGLGYKQFIQYIKGEADYDDTVERIKRETRRFAKRQLTWFRRDKRIVWIDPTKLSGDELADAIINVFLEGGLSI